ncbi:hypothetical protein AB0I63_37580, partial [Streptomyces sp. NPDC050428]
DRDAYKQRNTVERCINKLKQWRGLSTRYDKTIRSWAAFTSLRAAASIASISESGQESSRFARP